MNRHHGAALAVLLALGLASGCSGPGKTVDVHDVLLYAPVTSASPASEDLGLQVCVLPARRCATLDDAPGGKTVLLVSLTRQDGTAGDKAYAAALGYPVTFTTRSPWVLTLNDGFLRVETGKGGKHQLSATVEGAKGAVPPPVVANDEIWVWVGNPPTAENPDPRGTFVGVRLAK